MPRKKKLTPEERAANIAARKAAAAAKAEEVLAATPDDASKEVVEVEFIKREKIRWADLTAGGAPKPTMKNAMLCINQLNLDCRYNVFTARYSVNGFSVDAFNGDLSDMITRKIRDEARMRYGLDPGKEATSDALKRMCEENRFHPIQDYFNSLPKWDGVKRLGSADDDTPGWLTTYCGVKDTQVVRAQGRIVLMAAVRRTFEPGCKFDSVLVLEGPEGGFKSSAVKVLANGSRTGNEYFSDSPILNLTGDAERKQMELTAGVLFYELAELAGMKKGEQFAIKNFISKQEERARAAYAEYQQINPRCCVFIGTFNTDAVTGDPIEYLNVGDQRRWWPSLVGAIDIPGLERDRDQLFAEVMTDYRLDINCELYLPPDLEAVARAIAKTREKVDPLSDTLSSIHADVLRMAGPPDEGEQLTVTTDGKPVRRVSDLRGIMLFKGEEAEPFAMVGDDGEVWTSSKYVVELVPTNRRHDGSAIRGAMRAVGWRQVKDYRGGKQVRGWAYAAEPVAATAGEPEPGSMDPVEPELWE
jgi:hypothetical protein